MYFRKTVAAFVTSTMVYSAPDDNIDSLERRGIHCTFTGYEANTITVNQGIYAPSTSASGYLDLGCTSGRQ